jgi:hypothetical protein
LFLVKVAKNIPCHTKVTKHIEKTFDEVAKDENQNRTLIDFDITKDVLGSASPMVDLAPREHASPVKQPDIETKDDKNKFHDLELQRKLMEEQNKMKRSLLQEVISKHVQKTQAESQKLEEIKQALDVLDSELSNDVSILRKQIESATLHFNSVEKQYCAIEKTFLKAKQDLYMAHEKKEMLTEHLYTIIAHNEDRKAKRLSELMAKVGLSLTENGS